MEIFLNIICFWFLELLDISIIIWLNSYAVECLYDAHETDYYF